MCTGLGVLHSSACLACNVIAKKLKQYDPFGMAGTVKEPVHGVSGQEPWFSCFNRNI